MIFFKKYLDWKIIIIIIIVICGISIFFTKDNRSVTIEHYNGEVIEDRGDYDGLGKAIGKHTRYYDGKKTIESTYKNGELNGKYKIWYQNGNIKEITHFSNGKREGEKKEWSENGLLETHEIYKNDTLFKKIK